MPPGQINPNDFEVAILEGLAARDSSIARCIERLHVLSREFTGVGSFTHFRCEEPDAGAPKQHVGLDTLINMPGVPNGMGAVLFLKGGEPECLEVFKYVDDQWDGTYDGFSIEQTA
jgi:hypothetical protein